MQHVLHVCCPSPSVFERLHHARSMLYVPVASQFVVIGAIQQILSWTFTETNNKCGPLSYRFREHPSRQECQWPVPEFETVISSDLYNSDEHLVLKKSSRPCERAVSQVDASELPVTQPGDRSHLHLSFHGRCIYREHIFLLHPTWCACSLMHAYAVSPTIQRVNPFSAKHSGILQKMEAPLRCILELSKEEHRCHDENSTFMGKPWQDLLFLLGRAKNSNPSRRHKLVPAHHNVRKHHNRRLQRARTPVRASTRLSKDPQGCLLFTIQQKFSS